jgi:hypothetical protein
LVIRFGAGIDNGIFLIRDMLTEYLGFDTEDVEMLYFDIEPEEGNNMGTCEIHSGQSPPTAQNFKRSLVQILSSTHVGHVRFIYMDMRVTHHTSGIDSDDTKRGWILAEDEKGTRTEVLDESWLANTIKRVSLSTLVP